MTFEGFDAAPLIESGGFSPDLAAMAEPDAATLNAALREVARAERAATRAEALVLDLWVRPGGGFEILDLPARGATSAQAWAVLSGDNDQAAPDGGKDFGLRAAYGDKPPEPKPEPKEDEIFVKGTRPKTLDDGGGWVEWGGADEGGGGLGGGPGSEPPNEPDCATSNEIENKVAPDGAEKYYAPENVNSDYLNGALNHIVAISANNPLNRFAVMAELIDMYTDPNHPFFVDFKDWGTSRGPPGSVGADNRYFSYNANQWVSGSLFEPFGNYFFGMLCTYGGLAPEEIYAAAAWFSESNHFWEGDDPQDIPHVELGIADAQSKIAGNQFSIQVSEGNCGG